MQIAGDGSGEESREALATLCHIYWYPLYAFIRREGHGTDEARDLTQAFFAQLLEKRYLKDCDPHRGRFRSFLLASLKHFLANQWDRAQAKKRGGGTFAVSLDAVMQTGESRYCLEPRSELTPERIFERQWAVTVLNQVFSRLQAEMDESGTPERFQRLKPYLIAAEPQMPYGRLASELGTTEGALKVAVHRLRRRFREILRNEISPTVSDPGEVQDEIRYLISVLM